MFAAQRVERLRESSWLSRFFVALLLVGTAAALAWLPLLVAALLVAAIIFVTLVFIEPRWGLYLLPLAVPFGSIREVSVGPATIGGTEALLGLFLAAWLARGVAGREIRIERPPLWPLMGLWFGVMVLSALNADSIADSVKELIKWGEAFTLYAIAVGTIGRRDAAILVGTTLLAGALAAVEGIIQAIFQIGPDGFLFPLAGRTWLRAYGRFTQPNPFAGYLGVVLPLAYGLIAAGLGGGLIALRRGGLRRKLGAAGVVVAAALIGAALFLTLSRGGWIGAALALAVVGTMMSRRAATATLLAAGLGLGALSLGANEFLPPALAQRTTDFLPYINIFSADVRGVPITPDNFSVLERLAHWQAAYNMWGDAPWLGQGVGNYAATYDRFKVPPWDDALGHAHNLFLNTLAETGLIGLIAYLAFWGGALLLAARAVASSGGLWRGVAVGIVGAFVHLHAHNFFDNLYVHGIYLHLVLILAIAARLTQEHWGRELHDA